MSNFWHWFVIAITAFSLLALVWLLIANRKTSGNETTGHTWDGIEELDTPLPMWWVGMFVATIIFAVLYLVIYPGAGNFSGFLGWTSLDEHHADVAAHELRFAPLYDRLANLDEAALLADTQAQQVGRRLYLNHCATCHGIGARGAYGFPDLTDSEWLGPDDFETIKRTILQGRTMIMPPWGTALGESGVIATANFVRKLAGLPHDQDLARQGTDGYNTYCAACHGSDGSGNTLLGAPDLTNDIWLYGSSLEDIAQTIEQGRSGQMPPHADILGEERAHILAGYVKGLARE